MSLPAEGFPQPGERIGPYEVVRQLGLGGMGVVYEATDSVLKRRVALKIISPHLADDPDFRVRFTHEAQAQASLDSPHVVQVFAHGEADGHLYIASQLIPGGDLGAMIRTSGAPPPRIALDILAQISSGLADAHATGLVHRDIKPANVLLRIRGEDVNAYLADFGIARRTGLHETVSLQGFAVGTPAYMAPELHTGTGAPGPATDIYSLGCLLWATVTGQAPYGGTTGPQLASAHAGAPVPQVVETGPLEHEINRVLRSAMAKQPAQRYPSAHALSEDLRRVLRQQPAPAPATFAPYTPGPVAPYVPGQVPPYSGGTPSTAPRRSRSPLLVGGLAAAAVVLLVGAVVGAMVALRDDAEAEDPADRADRGSSTAPESGPESGPTDADGLTPDERRAADNIAAGLAGDPSFTGVDAQCIARELVRDKGVVELQEQGVLDEDLQFIGDTNPAVDAELFTDLITISIGCAFETLDLDITPPTQ